MRYSLIPLAYALPTITASLDRLGDRRSLTVEEHRELCHVAVRFVVTSQALLEYVRFLVGRNFEN